MAIANNFFPVLPGKTAAAREFAQAISGPRAKEYQELQARSGTTRETWSLQETPMGAFVLVWVEADDTEASFAELAQNQGEFATWFRGQVQQITGVDLAAPPDGPLPEVLLDWNA